MAGHNSAIIRTAILAVDDNPASLKLLKSMLKRGNYEVVTAENGKKALSYLYEHSESVDIILLDRMMPEMNGIEVCEVLKKDPKLRKIPIIMQTAADNPDQISEGIKAGVFYYLTKPLNEKTLLSVVHSAEMQMRQHKILREEMKRQRLSFGLVRILKCCFRTMEEAESLSSFLANFFFDPDQAITGISELMVNAIEHGNLDISYDEKSELIREKRWQEEIERRLNHPKWIDRKATVVFEKKEGACYLQITDQGQGFSWKEFMEVDPARAMHNHGRGIAMANMLIFDRLIYNDKGNQVTGMVKMKSVNQKDFYWNDG